MLEFQRALIPSYSVPSPECDRETLTVSAGDRGEGETRQAIVKLYILYRKLFKNPFNIKKIFGIILWRCWSFISFKKAKYLLLFLSEEIQVYMLQSDMQINFQIRTR